MLLAAEVDLSAVLGHIEAVRPDLLVIDSVQTIGCDDIDSTPGGVTQVRAVTAALVRVAKQLAMPTLLVGHVTKDGAIAGPRSLEHLVDVVLQFEGERNSRLRVLRAVKNRFGPVDEIGCFDISVDGIVEVADATGPLHLPTRLADGRHLRDGRRSRGAARCSPRCRHWSRPAPEASPVVR